MVDHMDPALALCLKLDCVGDPGLDVDDCMRLPLAFAQKLEAELARVRLLCRVRPLLNVDRLDREAAAVVNADLEQGTFVVGLCKPHKRSVPLIKYVARNEGNVVVLFLCKFLRRVLEDNGRRGYLSRELLKYEAKMNGLEAGDVCAPAPSAGSIALALCLDESAHAKACHILRAHLDRERDLLVDEAHFHRRRPHAVQQGLRTHLNDADGSVEGGAVLECCQEAQRLIHADLPLLQHGQDAQALLVGRTLALAVARVHQRHIEVERIKGVAVDVIADEVAIALQAEGKSARGDRRGILLRRRFMEHVGRERLEYLDLWRESVKLQRWPCRHFVRERFGFSKLLRGEHADWYFLNCGAVVAEGFGVQPNGGDGAVSNNELCP
eukprot:Opistho-2@26802